MRIGMFAGSFDPFTLGHKSVADRALPLFDRLIIAFGHNPAKTPWEPLEQRLDKVRRLYAAEPKVLVTSYTDLTADAARRMGAAFLVRGVRSVADFEYERTLADVNRSLTGVESVLVYSLPQYESLSSSVVRELAAFGHDISPYLPKI